MPTNYEVARKWLAGKEAKSSNGNLSCVSHTLYSYRTPIAHVVRDIEGNEVCLITCESFSATTEGKHKNAARKACNYVYYSVPFLALEPGNYGGRDPKQGKGPVAAQHAANLLYLQDQVQRELDRISMARKYTSHDHVLRLEAYVINYAAAFGLDFDTLAYCAKIGKLRDALKAADRA